MSLSDLGIEHKNTGPTLAAVVRRTVIDRKELGPLLSEVRAAIPAGLVDGPGFCTFLWVTSVQDGFDVEVGFPVRRSFASRAIVCRTLAPLEVLSLVHRGPPEGMRETQRLLFGTAAGLGIVSDEFMREVYLDHDNPLGQTVEVQFVVHDWPGLLTQHACRVLGEPVGAQCTAGASEMALECGVDRRFDWVRGVMGHLAVTTSPEQTYDILSSCAHVFPVEQVARLGHVYRQSLQAHGDSLAAVDAVLDFMSSDPGWGNRPRREGRVIFSSKAPRDPAGHAAATTKAERAKAYCFCPLIRHRLNGGMPVSFCNCGAGWYRQQWEGALGRPVRIQIIESLLQGDERCTFAIHLPEDL